MSISYPDRPADHNPMFSVIVPAYNVAGYIDRCLASLLEQEAENIEIIIVDDGSTDDTPAIIETFTDDSRLRCIRRTNGGLGAARNTGLDAARGQYICFVDSDDWIESDTLLAFADALAEAPDADLLVYGFYEVYGEERTPVRCPADFWSIRDSACNKLFHRSLFDGVRFDTDIWYEDLALVPYLFARALHPRPLDRYLYNYRRDRESSIMNSTDLQRSLNLGTAAKRCIARIQELAASEPERITARLGADWLERFYTIEIFIPGVLHRSRRVDDRVERRRYIRRMLDELPSTGVIQPDLVRASYGWKMGLGSVLYQRGHDELAHLLLHDMGRAKRGLFRRLGLSVADPG